MRSLLCAAALVSLCSPVVGERITITAASATYVTARDAVDIEIWFDRPVVLPDDWFSFGGWEPYPNGRVKDMFAIRSDGNIPAVPNDPFAIVRVSYDDRSRIVGEVYSGVAAHEFSGNLFTATIPFAETGLANPRFEFVANAFSVSNWSEPLFGFSSIDERVIHTPEPSSVALAALGAVLLGFHLVRRPRLGIRSTKRHGSRKPACVRAAAG